jgi:anthranilate phosphoribosyltransferase
MTPETAPLALQQAIAKVVQRQDLSEAEAEAAMDVIMGGEGTPALIGGYLTGLRVKGESVAEIAGSARAMRRAATPLPLQNTDRARLVDTCGTGGDNAGTFNISTTVAFVVAGAGVPVAKHGNRSVSSKSGSADVLGALGVNISLTPAQVAACIDQVGIGFLFAPTFHPAMKHAAPIRRELGVRTIFNLLGPLTNPAGAKRQLLGVFSPSLTAPLAGVLQSLGAEAALVVCGEGNVDELTTAGPNHLSLLRDGQVHSQPFDAVAELGLAPATPADLAGGDPATNAEITLAVLRGQASLAQRQAVLLNAAAALVVAGLTEGDALVDNLRQGLQLASQSIDSGAALAKLNALIQLSQSLAASQ